MKENQQASESVKLPGTVKDRYLINYDFAARPDGMDVATMAKLTDSGWLFYDSTKGNRPVVYKIDPDAEFEHRFVDVKGQSVDFKAIELQWQDEEFWRKELYMCRQSPLYYFENYYSKTPKPTQKEITAFLESVNLGAVTDSDDLQQEKMVKAREAFAASIELEDLKKLKPVHDALKKEYDDATDALEAKAFEHYGVVILEDDKDKSMAGRRLKDKIISEISKSDKAEAPEKLKAYLHQGRWDKKALKLTDKDMLLRLWNLVIK